MYKAEINITFQVIKCKSKGEASVFTDNRINIVVAAGLYSQLLQPADLDLHYFQMF